MKKAALTVAALSTLLIAGCGGESVNNTDRFVGNYNGVYRLVETSGSRNEWTANLTFSVTSSGTLTGTLERNITGFETSRMDGFIERDGRIQFEFQFPGMSNRRTATGFVDIAGNLIFVDTSDDRLNFTGPGSVTGFIEFVDVRRITP